MRNNTGLCDTRGANFLEWLNIEFPGSGTEVSFKGSKRITMLDPSNQEFTISCTIQRDGKKVVVSDTVRVVIRDQISETADLELLANGSEITVADFNGNATLSWVVPDFYIDCKATSNPRVLNWNNVTADWSYNQSFAGSKTIGGIGSSLGDRYSFTLTCKDEGDGGQTSISVFVDIVSE